MPLIGRIASAAARGYGLFANVVQAAVDPYFNYVVALLHGDGTNGGQNNTFLDSSTNNFTITRNGNTTQGSFSPFSQTGWSGYFDGNGDFLTFTNQGTTTAFTCECWFYRGEDVGGYHIIFGGSNASNVNPNNVQFPVYNNGSVALVLGGSAVISASGTNAAKNQWNHIAWVRSGTSCAIFVNGVRVGTGTSSAALNVDRIGTAGGLSAGTYDARGYISNARITTTAVYDPSLTTCTVPTAPLTAVTGTYLLTLQSNRFVDNSASPLTITRNGDVSVQPFSPFNPTTAYSTSAVGGSGYFDGSGDYLTAAGSTSLTFGTGDFTIEGWFYTASPATNMGLFQISTTAGGLEAGNTNNVAVYCSSSVLGVYYNDTFKAGTTAIRGSAWTHFALVRNSGTDKLYVNGVADAGFGSSADTRNYTGGNIAVGGYFSTSYLWNGYISGFRVVKGTAVYTTDFTPPTAPPTAISNTQFLLNYTNGAIFDNAAVADYETVGNAQISTSVKKYGTGSMAFDGTGDYLPATNKTLFDIGGEDFTAECWVNFNSLPADYQAIFSKYGADYQYQFLWDGANSRWFWNVNSTVSGNTTVTFSDSLSTGIWYHIALVRIGTSYKVYKNGTQVGTTQTISGNINAGTRPFTLGSTFNGSNVALYFLNGYIDDFRFTKGIARYPYNFTPPTAEFPNIGGTVTLTADPYFDYTTLLLPGNGTNGAQNNTFLDSSTNAFSITRNGNTTQGTFSPFSQTGWGNYFNGPSTGSYLGTPTNTAFQLTTSDFTIEFWAYTTDITSDTTVCQTDAGGSGYYGMLLNYSNGTNITWYATSNGSSWDVINGGVLCTAASIKNQWVHFAYVRSGTSLKAYVNGTLAYSATSSASIYQSANKFIFGSSYAGSHPSNFGGYISNFRYVKGTAVYTGNFTPSTTPLTAISGTQLLACQSNRFLDASSNAFALTIGGSPSIQAFSPFNPTAAWSAATNGGSGYFDGSGDYLSAGDQTAFEFGSGDYTVELWWYPTSSGDQNIIGKWDTGGTEWILQWRSAGYYRWASGGSVVSDSSTITLRLNSWNHVAVTKSGTSLRIYTNGTQINTTATEGTISATSTALTVGASQLSSSPLNVTGYMSDVRILKGTAQYTGSTYTVPTAPLTAITNTSLLLNFTNAGIYDATSKNDLETVGNAQISTTQSKFGGSSMYFDGTGDWLLSTASPNLALGSGDFTIETWVRRSTPGSGAGVILQMSAGTDSYSLLFGYISSSNYVVYISSNGSSWDIAAAQVLGAIENDVWVHYALTRYGSTFRTFRNGIQQATWTSSSSIYQATNQVTVGRAQGTHNYVGYMQDVRITKGIARYTSNFTPPTTAFLTL